MIFRQADIVLGGIFQVFEFIVGQGTDAFDRGAVPEVAALEHPSRRDQGAGAKECPGLEYGAVEDAGADAHQAMLTDLAAVEYCLMAYGDAVMDDEGRPAGQETTIVGDMQYAAVLDIGLGADADMMDVATGHHQGPDGGPLPDLHVAHHHGGLIDPDPGGEAGLLAQIGADVGHGVTGARNSIALAANAISNRWN